MLRECEISARMQAKAMTISLRPFRADDQEFLYQLYASTRLHEIAGLGWPAPQQEMFLRMQFNAQYRSYEAAYGQAEHQIVEHDGKPVGRIMVLWEKDFTLLVDIALLAEYRGRAIGGDLLHDLIQRCTHAGVPLRLQVLKNNPALRLYQRLGFINTGEDQMYIQMERQAG
jgi:ribosomal protein S18 acetylase RimI-like enzyme